MERSTKISASTKDILKTKGLIVGYSTKNIEKQILDPFDISLNTGELIGLVGINGSGKSTLLRTLAGLQKPLSGSIHLQQKAMEDYSSNEFSRTLGVVLTGQTISGNLDVRELVTLGRQPYTNWSSKLTPDDHLAIENALEAAELKDLSDRPCHTLSDGQMQRALIARALAQDTPLLLLDEPTTHLDLHHKASVFAILKAACKDSGKTVLFSSHDIELVLPFCDRTIVLHEGSLLMDTPQRLIADGVFEGLFPEELVGFDRRTGRFFLR